MACGVALAVAAGAAASCGDAAPQSAGETPSPVTTTLPAGATSTAASAGTIASRVTSFDGFPLVWLGTSYDSDGDGVGDLALSDAYYQQGRAFDDPRTGKELRPAIRRFTLVYGTCEIPPGDSECTNPLTVVVFPANQELAALPLSTVRVRGVDATDFGSNGLLIETADFKVSIPAPRDDAMRVANALFGANALASWITKDTDFRPLPTPAPTAHPSAPANPNATTPYPIVTPPLLVGTPTAGMPATEVATVGAE
jgi:hypothetical protein